MPWKIEEAIYNQLLIVDDRAWTSGFEANSYNITLGTGSTISRVIRSARFCYELSGNSKLPVYLKHGILGVNFYWYKIFHSNYRIKWIFEWTEPELSLPHLSHSTLELLNAILYLFTISLVAILSTLGHQHITTVVPLFLLQTITP